MKLTFLGTRGYIDPANRRHRRHSAAMVSYYGRRVMIDCGQDWLGRLDRLRPRAILVTHGHPDHAGGLADGAPCPVYATADTWEALGGDAAGLERRTAAARRPVEVEGLTCEAFAVEHSTRAPAVGWRITAGRVSIFYAPDVVYIHDRAAALQGARLYVGDGATLASSMVRTSHDQLIGHTPMRTQLTWCAKEGVPRAVFTHLGAEVVAGDERSLRPRLEEMAAERGVQASFARDGQEMVLR